MKKRDTLKEADCLSCTCSRDRWRSQLRTAYIRWLLRLLRLLLLLLRTIGSDLHATWTRRALCHFSFCFFFLFTFIIPYVSFLFRYSFSSSFVEFVDKRKTKRDREGGLKRSPFRRAGFFPFFVFFFGFFCLCFSFRCWTGLRSVSILKQHDGFTVGRARSSVNT